MQRAELKFMNLFTTICVTRLRRDSGKERHYQASYSPPAGYALFQHSRAKRITRSLKENAAPPLGSRRVPGTMGLWPGMERKKADCRSRWKTSKPWLLALGQQKNRWGGGSSSRAGPLRPVAQRPLSGDRVLRSALPAPWAPRGQGSSPLTAAWPRMGPLGQTLLERRTTSASWERVTSKGPVQPAVIPAAEATTEGLGAVFG